MTKEEFNNQKWYKNMPVLLSKDHKKPVFVKGVNFGDNLILVGDQKEGAYAYKWMEYDSIVIVDSTPSALDLIAAEKHELEKQAWYNDGVVIGLRICKGLWAQGTISHEQLRENELHYLEELKSVREKIDQLENQKEVTND